MIVTTLVIISCTLYFQPKQNKAEAKGSEYNTQTVRPFLSNFPSPSATNNEKARQPVTTPPLSNTSSGIGTDSSAVSPTESPSQDDAEWRDRNSEDHLINVVDNSSNCSPNSGKTEKLFSADSNFLSGGPDLSNSALPPQNNVFTGNLEKFLASTKQAEPPPEEDSDTETEDLDPGIPKRPRSRLVKTKHHFYIRSRLVNTKHHFYKMYIRSRLVNTKHHFYIRSRLVNTKHHFYIWSWLVNTKHHFYIRSRLGNTNHHLFIS